MSLIIPLPEFNEVSIKHGLRSARLPSFLMMALMYFKIVSKLVHAKSNRGISSDLTAYGCATL